MKQNLRIEAQRLREQGLSLKQIANMLGASKSSVSLWIRDVQLTGEQKLSLHNRRRLYGELNMGAQANIARSKATRVTYQEEGRKKAREAHPLHLAGCMLYWAEGAKTRNGIYFVNSDPNMILLFARFLRVELSVNDSEFAIRIHCHTSIPEEIIQIEQYWLSLLKLPATCIRKTYIKDSVSSRKNKLENGVCDIRVHRTDLVQHIFGAIQEYGGFDNPDWLF